MAGGLIMWTKASSTHVNLILASALRALVGSSKSMRVVEEEPPSFRSRILRVAVLLTCP